MMIIPYGTDLVLPQMSNKMLLFFSKKVLVKKELKLYKNTKYMHDRNKKSLQ